jgi:hypothetical protein
MNPTEIKKELYNAATLIEAMLDNFRYSDYEIEEIHSTINALYQAANLIQSHVIDND